MSTDTARAVPCAVGPAFQDPRLYVEEAVLPEGDLLALAKECGLDVPPNLLAWYTENGYFAPVIEIPILDEPETEPILGYSRWQLLPLFELERARSNALKIWPDRPAGEQDRQSWQWQLQAVRPGLRTLSSDFRRWLELVVLLQNKYVGAGRGHRNWTVEIRSSIHIEHEEYLTGEYTARVAGEGPLQEVGLTLAQAVELRREFGLRSHWLDPLGELYRLIRFMPLDVRRKLTGTARLAQELYVADRILEQYLTDLTGQRQQDTEDLAGNPDDDWARRFYGRSKDYRDAEFLEVLLTQFGLHPAPAVVLFVEGESEGDLYPGVSRLLGYGFGHFGIEVEVLGGVNNAPKVVEIVRYLSRPAPSGEGRLLRRPLVTPYVVVDREGPVERGRLIGDMTKSGLQGYLHVWHRDLERDNFNALELSTCLNETYGIDTTVAGVESWMATRVPLDKWISRTLHKSIRKRDLIPALLRFIEADLGRGDLGRPVVRLMIKIIRYASRNLPVDDPRREGRLIFGH
jgi:hypothetical protein